MTSRMGRRNRRRVYKRPEPKGLAREREIVSCPLCDRTFDASRQDDPTEPVTCPGCHAELAAGTFDKAAGALVERAAAGRSAAAACREGLSTLDARKARVPRLLRPLADRWYFDRRRKPLEEGLAEALAEESTAKAAMRRAAFGRFFVSRWHRETLCPVRWRDEDGAPQGFSPRYTDDGTWDPAPIGAGGHGAAAEMRVYDRLLEACGNEASPLHGAELIPCLRIPNLGGRRDPRGGVPTTEIDVVLLCSKGAAVVEVKSARCDVVAPKDHHVIYSHGPKRECEPAPASADDWAEVSDHMGWSTSRLTGAFGQNGHHGDCLAALPIPLSRKDVAEQVVLVDVGTFVGDTSFEGGVGVSYMRDDDARFVAGLEVEMGRRPRVLQDSQVPKVARTLRQLRDTSIRQSFRQSETGR
jgi:hypothetical protein